MLTAKLIDSVAAENLTVAAECLEEGGSPNTLSGDGATAMHIAAGVGVDAVRLMLAYGGDPNVRSVDGSTPLHVAAAWGDKDTLRLLLHNGANPNVIDHDGQRAVDVARSEERAACVDFLKYYTMLVAVGDEEEGPMFTSELIDSTQEGVPHCSSRDCPSPSRYHGSQSAGPPAHYSDEEDPVNLSDQYTEALSRRLSRLLTDGGTACLDATSPDCPYIGEKRDRYVGAGDRTLLAEDPHLSDLSDSDTSANDLAASEMQSGCRCHSNHCCLHNQPRQPDVDVSQERAMRCGQHCLDRPALPDYHEAKTTYARNLEKKMKQKYFPDVFGKDVHRSDRERSADPISTHCSHSSYFTVLSPQQAERVGHVGYTSPHALSSAHRNKATETGHCQNMGHSPPVPDPVKSSPCSCSHHAQRQLSSPNRREHSSRSSGSYSPRHQKHPYQSSTDSVHHRHGAQNQPCSPESDELHHSQRGCHSAVRRRLQLQSHVAPHPGGASHHCRVSPQTSSSSNACRSPPGQRKGRSIPSQNVLHHSLSDHHEEECCDEGHHCSVVSQSLRKQATYPPAEQSHVSASPTRSPVTIMRIQPERSSPPPGVFQHAVRFPFTPSSPKLGHAEFTSFSDSYKKQNKVAGSCSSHSVDSGFCEKCTTTKQELGADDVGALLKCEPNFLRSRTREHGSYVWCGKKTVAGSTSKQMSDIEKEVKNLERSYQSNSYIKFSGGKDSCQSATKKLDNHTSFKDGYNIVSSNLRERSLRQNLPRQSKHEHAVCVEDGEMRAGRGAPRQEPAADGQDLESSSDSDSFLTCEEASVQETDLDAKSEHGSHRQKSQPHSEHLAHAKQHASVSSPSGKTVAVDVKKQEKAVSCIPDFKMESLGFNVSESEKDGKKYNHNSFTKRKKTSTTSSPQSNDSQTKKKSDFAKANLAAEQRSVMTSVKDDSQARGPLRKSWLPPSATLPDDSDLLTSDESFMARAEGQRSSNKEHTGQSNHVSRWLQNVPATTSLPKPKDAKQGGSRSVKRTSDESVLSVASSVQEYLYRDKENGIALIERHIPSDFSGSSGRPSLEGGISLDADATVSYDWTDFSIYSDDASSSSSSFFDITAGHTLKREETLKTDDSNGSDEDCCSGSDDYKEESEDLTRQEDKESKTITKKNIKKDKPKMSDNDTKETSQTTSDIASQQTDVTSQTDTCASSSNAAISPELASLSNTAIYQSLKDLGEDPGPVLPSTRQTYLQLLANLHSGKRRLGLTTSQPGYSSELNQLLSGSLDMEDQANAELFMVAQFQSPDGRTWREGTIKSCFNYLLMDPRVTRNLPLRAKSLSDTEAFKIFLSAVFYIGKGKRSRPYCHLYEAISQQKSPKLKVSQKVQQILDVWSAGLGVVSLHCFQNVIPVEAYTREACMVDAMGLGRLTNVKKGDYYGVASTWPTTRRRCMGAYLLRKAFQIFLSEGERQICPLDIRKGQ